MIEIAGIQVSDRAAARLALILNHAGEQALSNRVGRAWDKLADHVELAPGDHARMLSALNQTPRPEPELEDLRLALEARVARGA